MRYASPAFTQSGAWAAPRPDNMAQCDRIVIAKRESRILASLRDTLLRKLISGELRVKDAERIAARYI